MSSEQKALNEEKTEIRERNPSGIQTTEKYIYKTFIWLGMTQRFHARSQCNGKK